MLPGPLNFEIKDSTARANLKKVGTCEHGRNKGSNVLGLIIEISFVVKRTCELYIVRVEPSQNK